MICGCAGFLAGWLSLATADTDHEEAAWYREHAATKLSAHKMYAHERRVLPIPS